MNNEYNKGKANLINASGGSSEEATEAVPPQIKLNKKKIKNIIFN
jgi:hypothetical protein